MAKFKEIEIKWDAEAVKRNIFNRQLRFLLNKKYPYKFIKVSGFDIYYTSQSGEVVRHRQGKGTNELTVKNRISKNTTTIRKEVNLRLSSKVSQLEVKAAMNGLGFNKVMPIYKDCDIYVIKDGKYIVDVVWYKVSSQKRNSDRVFLEVEIHNAPIKTSLQLLKKWNRFVESLGLSKQDIIKDSLYEIFSGKRYKLRRN